MDKLQSSEKDVKVAEKNLTILNEENKRVIFGSELCTDKLAERPDKGTHPRPVICEKHAGYELRRDC